MQRRPGGIGVTLIRGRLKDLGAARSVTLQTRLYLVIKALLNLAMVCTLYMTECIHGAERDFSRLNMAIVLYQSRVPAMYMNVNLILFHSVVNWFPNR